MQGGLLRLLDATLGRMIYYAFFLLCPLAPKTCKGDILAIKLWAMGDSIDALPAMQALKKALPGRRLAVLCTKNNEAVFRLSGIADYLIIMDYKNPVSAAQTFALLAKKGFSVCADFEPFAYVSAALAFASRAKTRLGFSNRKLLYTKIADPQKIHVVENFMNLPRLLAPAPSIRTLLRLYVSRNARAKAKRLLPVGKLIGLHPGSSSSSKIRRWDERNFANLADSLACKHRATVVITGGRHDMKAAVSVEGMMKTNPVNLAGRIDIETLAACMEKMSLFIANDSGPMHLAAAMGVPTVGLFGPNKPELYGPYGPRCIGLYKGPQEPYIKPFKAEFPEKYMPEYDVNNITVKEALKASENLLARGNTRPL